MFTGIINHLGILKEQKGTFFTFQTPQSFAKELIKGASVAVNGACLTVVKVRRNAFVVELMPETRKKTMFANLKPHSVVNLELPMRANSRFDGHIVQGHIDGVESIVAIEGEKNAWLFRFSASLELMQYIVPKGSIAVNGISLTVIEVGKNWFSTGIIPYTFAHTMLHEARIGDKVNIETDILAKYVYSFYSGPPAGGAD